MSAFKRLLPLANRVLIKKVEATKKSSGGILLQNVKESNPIGVVIEIGNGTFDAKGKQVPLVVKVGDTVLLPDFGGQKVNINSHNYYVFRDTDILGILSN